MFTVEHTRKSSEDELLKSFLERIDRMSKLGTTLLEAKSGYGLN
jgi:imidazolonepropionase